jgi:hypothetical protein
LLSTGKVPWLDILHEIAIISAKDALFAPTGLVGWLWSVVSLTSTYGRGDLMERNAV